MSMFDDLSPERRKEIRAIKSEEEYAKLTPHEMAYYRLTAPTHSEDSLRRFRNHEPISFEEIIDEFNRRKEKSDK